MFCGKCGTQNVDGTPFCAGCGAPLGGAANGGKKVNLPKVGKLNLKDRKTLISLGAGLLALVLIFVLLFGGNSPKGVVKKYMKAIQKADAAAVVKLLPKKVVNEAKDEMDMSNKEWKEYLEEMSEDLADSYEAMEEYYDGKLKITYEIKDVEKLDKDDLKDLKEEYKDELDIKVKDARIVEVKVTTKIGDEKMKSEQEILVIKVGGKWCLDPYSADIF